MQKSVIMKKLIVLIGCVALMSAMNINVSPVNAQAPEEDVHLIVSPELSELVSMWITEYSSQNPGAVIRSSEIEEGGSINVLEQGGTLGLVTEEYLHSLNGPSLWLSLIHI